MDAPALLHFVSHPTRAAILTRLQASPAPVTDLVAAAGQEQSNVSHHLRKLRDAGLVAVRPRGRLREYRLSDREIGHLLNDLDKVARRLDKIGAYARLGLPLEPGFHGYG